MSAEETRRIKEKYEEELLKLTGVTGIGFNHSIHIYVERITPKMVAFLPKQLDGVKVQVIETGKLRPLILNVPLAHPLYADRTARIRPAPGGVSCGHTKVTAGTLGCAAIDRSSGDILGLSNNHVIALRWGNTQIGNKGDEILQPGPADGGRETYDGIGTLERWIPVELDPAPNRIDAAVFRSDQLTKNILEVGQIESSIIAEVGMNLVKSGRTSGVNFSSVFDVNATVKISGDGDCIFHNQIIAKPALLSPGDSGSWVGHADSHQTVGLGYAGSEDISIINKGPDVESMLNIFIVPPSPKPISWGLVLGMYGGVLGTVQFAVSQKRARRK